MNVVLSLLLSVPVPGALGHATGSPVPVAGEVVIRAGTILPVHRDALSPGAVLVRDGLIVEVGRDVAVPPAARILDFGPAAVVTPGFLDARSHLGLRGDQTAFALDADLTRVLGPVGEPEREVARSGVTTVLLQSWSAAPTGSRITAVKTAGQTRAQRVVDDLAGIAFHWADNVDPLLTKERLDKLLKSGRQYHDRWLKYHEELRAWEEARALGKATAAPAQEPEPPSNRTESRSDPVTGTWELTYEGRRGPTTVTLVLKLTGNQVTGSYSGGFGRGGSEPRPVSGTFDGTRLQVTVESDRFPITLEGTVGEDRFTGTMQRGDNEPVPLTGVRTEKTVTEVVVVDRRRARDDGRPVAPELKPELEPYRRLFAGQVPVVVEATSALVIREAVDLFVQRHEVALVLLGAGELDRLPGPRPAIQGVVAPPEIVTTRRDRPFVPLVELSRRDWPLAIQSHGATAARGLAMNAAYAVRQGFSPTAALRSLTLEPARMFQVDDRVGTLERGKDADLLVFSGDPFDVSSRLLLVLIDGHEVPLESR